MSTEDETEGVFDCEVSPERLKYLRECAEKSIQANKSRIVRFEVEDALHERLGIALNRTNGSLMTCSNWDGKERCEKTVWEALVSAESRLTSLLSRLEGLAKKWEAASKSATAPIEMIPANFCAAELRVVMEGK